MEDKRITRTKQLLRQALVDLLAGFSFEKITVKAICDQANVSRITFYTHYTDKYQLAEEIFQEMISLGTAEYTQMQKTNNPDNDPILAYCNILDCILNLYDSHFDFFRHTIPSENPYLSASFYRHVAEIIEHHTHKASTVLAPKYPVRAITAFLCFGLGGFISGSGQSAEQNREDAKAILRGVLSSDILTQRLH